MGVPQVGATVANPCDIDRQGTYQLGRTGILLEGAVDGSRPVFDGFHGDWSFWVNPEGLLAELSSCAFICDTNVLLRPYKVVRREERDVLLRALEEVADRMWVPHQVMVEVDNMRSGAVAAAQRDIANVADAVLTDFRKIEMRCRRGFHDWGTDRGEAQLALRNFRAAAQRLVQFIREQGDSHDLVEEDQQAFVEDRLKRLVQGRVWPDPGQQKRRAWEEDGKNRESERRPPVWADRKKPGDRKYNDGLIWQEIKEFASECPSTRPIVLVTLDLKDNGWVEHRNGRPNGAHSSLVAELNRDAGAIFRVISTEELIAYAETKLYDSPDVSTSDCGPADVEGALRPLGSHLFN